MERTLLSNLLRWKTDPERKPLLLLGARQVGKTWLMKEFGRLHFRNCAYVSLDKNRAMAEAFTEGYDLRQLLLALQIQTGCEIMPEDTLIVLDEIQSCPAAITALKYFCEDAREYHVIAAGSLLGVSDLVGTGFPVGKVDRLSLYPMSFLEFLNATGNGQLNQLIQSRDWKLITLFQEKISMWLRYYYFIGGMPEAVSSFATYQDFARIRKIHHALLKDYRSDFGKHAPKEIKPKIEKIWDVLPAQLAKKNKKFVYSQVAPRENTATLEPALGWLKDTGLISIVSRITKPAIPLSAYTNGAFKVFFVDVGLLSTASGLDIKTILEGNRIFQEFKGALTEQYVQQELMATSNVKPYYWTSPSGQAEVDFLAEIDGDVIPIEAKAEKNLKAKSLKLYAQKYLPTFAVRTSMAHYYRQEIPMVDNASPYTLIDIPLPCISQLPAELQNG